MLVPNLLSSLYWQQPAGPREGLLAPTHSSHIPLEISRRGASARPVVPLLSPHPTPTQSPDLLVLPLHGCLILLTCCSRFPPLSSLDSVPPGSLIHLAMPLLYAEPHSSHTQALPEWSLLLPPTPATSAPSLVSAACPAWHAPVQPSRLGGTPLLGGPHETPGTSLCWGEHTAQFTGLSPQTSRSEGKL